MTAPVSRPALPSQTSRPTGTTATPYAASQAELLRTPDVARIPPTSSPGAVVPAQSIVFAPALVRDPEPTPVLQRMPPIEAIDPPNAKQPPAEIPGQAFGQRPNTSAPPPSNYACPIDSRGANNADAGGMLAPYLNRVDETAGRPGNAPQGLIPDDAQMPDGYRPWWSDLVRGQSAVSRMPRSIAIEQLVESALQYSSFVRVVSVEPEILRSNIVVEEAAFDWRTFIDSTYRKANDPIGNSLTTGTNATRFLDNSWNGDVGATRKNALGGELTAAQRFGTQSNNSRFLLPNPQGTSRLELQYTQPLMNGLGRCVNESRIVLAQLGTDASSNDSLGKLQDHLVRVTEGYWELYRSRAEYFQRAKLLSSAQSTLEILEGRAAVDSVSRQVLRAKAAVASRRSEIVRAQTAIRNAESQLRLLVNSPELINLAGNELTPAETPLLHPLHVGMKDSLQTGLLNRPDIATSIRQVRGAAVQQEVADNQVLPKLDMVASTYVAGLAGDRDFVSATGKQFSEGGPGYALGFVFEMPWGNRAALARQQQRQLEMNRALSQFRLTVEQSLTSIEVAVREADTTYREMVGRHQAMVAADNEVNYLYQRWTTIPGIDDSAAFLLENLLDAQARLTDEEGAMVRAEVGYANAIVRLKREMGTLLRSSPCVAANPTAYPLPDGTPVNASPYGPTTYQPAPANSPNGPAANVSQRPAYQENQYRTIGR